MNSKSSHSIQEAAVTYEVATPVTIPPTEDDLMHSDGKYVSEEDYFKYFYGFGDVNYEWNNGILEAKPMSDTRKVRMYAWFLSLLREFLKINPIAGYTALEMGFRMEIPDPDIRGAKKRVIRKPDLGIVLNDNPVPLNDDDRTYAGICDLCIESLSDSTQSEIDRDTKEKLEEYKQAKIKEYYILDDVNDEMHFYRLNDLGNYVEIPSTAQGIIRSQVLKGFQFRIDDLRRQPPLVEMALDPVYRSFVLPEYQEATQRAEEERLRAEEERLRAEEERRGREKEKSRADRYAELLRKYKIDPDNLPEA